MSRVIPVRSAAGWLLRLLLPLCLVAAASVVVLGLYRVVADPAASPVSAQSPSLRLGGSTGAAAPETLETPVVRPPAAPALPSRAAVRRERLVSPVTVMNASGVAGLAGRTAAALRQRGVHVAAVANLLGISRPSARTVFYPPGARAQAQALAGISGAAAVMPAPATLHTDGTLVLVLTGSGVQGSS